MATEVLRPRILVADDDPAILTFIRRGLQDGLVYDVVTVPAGEALLSAIAAIRPDVVVLDLLMPKRNGFEVCRVLKSRADASHVPICVLSALDEEQARDAALAAGADDFLSKPVHLAELRLRVHVLAKRKLNADYLHQTATEMERWRREHQDLVHLLVHDMRGPLSAMASATAFLEKSDDPEDREFLVSVFSDAVKRLTYIVDNVASRSALEVPDAVALTDDVDLTSLVRQVGDELRRVFALREQRLILELAEAPVRLHGDALLLHQLVSNALLNAVEYAPPGSAIVARTAVTDTDVLLTVTDAGAAIPAELAETILEAGAHGELKRRGVRIGRAQALVVLKMAAPLHGGTVQLAPLGKSGLRLTVTLPRRLDAPEAARPDDQRTPVALDMEMLLATSLTRVRTLEIGTRGALVERHAGLTPGSVVATRFVDLPHAFCTARVATTTDRGVELAWLTTNSAWDDLVRSTQRSHAALPTRPAG